ncbi:pheromone processing endoprotease [Entomophthora muscae]|uniref:Pheromone processing endoprotease n=1 Tax=Entomophthora muscae TaxID=34485 RepID=A0ACC2TUC5_9FUNG|nr:pheromone processing endoprotease [Entomophthora muscae]
MAVLTIVGLTGKDVNIAVLDNGSTENLEDLLDNYVSDWLNFIDEQSPATSKEFDAVYRQGNQLLTWASIIAAPRDTRFGVGVAYEAKVSVIQTLGIGRDPEHLFDAFTHRLDYHDIYSYARDASNFDYGKHRELYKALREGSERGRAKNGAIYVVASRGRFHPHANSIHTLAVGTIASNDRHLPLAMPCTATLLVAYSAPVNTTGSTAGTATSMVSGAAALALQKRPELTWRDMQYLMMNSAKQVDPNHTTWTRTFCGRHYSAMYGYGKLDVQELIKQTASHDLLGPQSYHVARPDEIQANGETRLVYTVTMEMIEKFNGFRVEHVDVAFNVQTQSPNLKMTLVSPNGFMSQLYAPGQERHAWGTYGDAMLSLAHWGEPIEGNWTIVLENANLQGITPTITFWGEKCRLGPCHPDLLIYVMLLTGILLIGILLFFVCRFFMRPIITPPSLSEEFLPAYSPQMHACPPPPYST